MFTGIIEKTGVVREILVSENGRQLSIDTGWSLDDIKIGASVAINGCCLTIVQVDGLRQLFEAGDETLSRTNIGRLQVGSTVNLERAMPANGRFDGHIVSGHVDCTGVLVERTNQGEWSEFRFEIPADFAQHLAPKGSIAVDGVSLTLVNVTDCQFTLALIPHTLEVTTLGQFQVEQPVNIETDILAKYIERQLEFRCRE